MHSAGLTLHSLLVTLALAALLTGLAIPNFSYLVEQHRVTAVLNQFIGAVALARTEALTQNKTVSLCPSAGQTCLPRNQWHAGQLVFTDHNGNGRVDTNDQLLRYLPGWSGDIRVRWAAFRARSYLEFTPRGHTNWQNGSFILCPGHGDLRLARRLVLNIAGRTYRAHDTDGDGIDEGPNRSALRCN